MSRCIDCGKRIHSAFTRCWQCNRAFVDRKEREYYEQMTPQGKADELESYYNNECVMCGKEGADYRSDGKCYCPMCWTFWNS